MRVEEVRTGLVARLRGRRAEIEQAALNRVSAFADPVDSADPEYAEGLRAAVGAAIAYGIDATERSEDRAPPIPTALLAQARLAARNRVSIETVLRRYLAGYTLLGDFVVEEAERGGLRGMALKRLLRAQAAIFDRLLAAVSEEYNREQQGRLGSADRRHAERVARLLAGDLVDTSELAYDFEGWHLGIVGSGLAPAGLEEVAKRLDRRLMVVRNEEDQTWAWFGSRRRFESEQIESLVSPQLPHGTLAAIGEPGEGIAGWRLTHRQAQAALPIALRGGEPLVRYGEVALLASILRDDLLVTRLRQAYLDPLAEDRDGGAVARETLRAYFAAERNVSSAAAILGVSRQTVGSRLRMIEERIGRPLSGHAAEIEAAVRLDNCGLGT